MASSLRVCTLSANPDWGVPAPRMVATPSKVHMDDLFRLILVLGFSGFLAFIAFAPKELRQIALAGMWGLMALATVVSILYGLFA